MPLATADTPSSQKQHLCKPRLGINGECILEHNTIYVGNIKIVVQFFGIEREIPV
jgi:hypothetical protein